MIKYIWRRFSRTEPINSETGFWRLLRDEKPVGEFDSGQKVVIDRLIAEFGSLAATIETDISTGINV